MPANAADECVYPLQHESYRRSRHKRKLEVTSSSIGGLADNVVARLNEDWIDLPAISDIKETVPALEDESQGLEGFCTAVADHPCQDSSLVVIGCCPNKRACYACYQQRFVVYPGQSPQEFLQALGHRAIDVQLLE